MVPVPPTLIKRTRRHLGKVVAGVDHLRLEAEVGDEELEQLLGVARLLDLARHLGSSKIFRTGSVSACRRLKFSTTCNNE
jgi:hypothetical protein